VTARVETPVVVVPCYNEEHRIDEEAFVEIARSRKVRLLFVDDGSTDATGNVLARLARRSTAIDVFALGVNTGKAEAVRRGMLRAVRSGAPVVGYYDADLATPPRELFRLVHTLRTSPELAGAFGCRVARMGSAIQRNALRHYLGRTYATVASMALGVTVYDTQCGAKLFRVNETFAAALSEPFRSSWAFDVELLLRLLRGTATAPPIPETAFVEVPLEAWRDVGGSKMRIGPAATALLDLVRIARSTRRERRPRSSAPPPRGETRVIAPQVSPDARRAPTTSTQLGPSFSKRKRA
jgi:glycosyltransferase involved in cell wall biosynthesis